MTKTYEVSDIIVPFMVKELSDGDLTGAFPYTSLRSSKYIYATYDYDSNAILVHPLKTKGAQEIKKAHLADRLRVHVHMLQHCILDNE